jgi:hypothetical protein
MDCGVMGRKQQVNSRHIFVILTVLQTVYTLFKSQMRENPSLRVQGWGFWEGVIEWDQLPRWRLFLICVTG